jgi:hypothetical protein
MKVALLSEDSNLIKYLDSMNNFETHIIKNEDKDNLYSIAIFKEKDKDKLNLITFQDFTGILLVENLEKVNPEILEIVDEVILIPTSQTYFKYRIENLMAKKMIKFNADERNKNLIQICLDIIININGRLLNYYLANENNQEYQNTYILNVKQSHICLKIIKILEEDNLDGSFFDEALNLAQEICSAYDGKIIFINETNLEKITNYKIFTLLLISLYLNTFKNIKIKLSSEANYLIMTMNANIMEMNGFGHDIFIYLIKNFILTDIQDNNLILKIHI